MNGRDWALETKKKKKKKRRASKIYDTKKDKWIENYDTKPKNK